MDPNETLNKLRNLTEWTLENIDDADSDEMEDTLRSMADFFEALDGWLSKGGFLPQDWQKNR